MRTQRFTSRTSIVAATGLVIGLHAASVLADPVYHPSGPALTFGGMTHRQLSVSDMGNPAHPAINPLLPADSVTETDDDSKLEDNASRYGIGLGVGLGIEYDGNDNLFKLLDSLGSNDAIAPGGGGGSGGGDSGKPGPPIVIPPGALPDETLAAIEAAVAELRKEAIAIGAVLFTATTGLNAKAFLTIDAPVLISNRALGGTWTFDANRSVITNIQGLHDPIEFDVDTAISILKARNATPGTYDLTGGLSLTVNPDGSTTFKFENNSGVITRAADIIEFSIGYSRKIWQQKDNRVYIGIKPRLLEVGLSNVAIPVANIENARDIFENLDSSSFKYTQDYSVDLGAIWAGRQFQLGATVTNLNEPVFNYPASDLSGFTNQAIINAIRAREIYTMERQLKIEGGLITPNGAWGINFGYDVNAVPDPMGDDYQWLSVGAGYASGRWWLPGLRIGARKNLSGTGLTYITGGLTLFNIINLDLATTTDTIEVDGTTVPRGLIANISAQVLF